MQKEVIDGLNEHFMTKTLRYFCLLKIENFWRLVNYKQTNKINEYLGRR